MHYKTLNMKYGTMAKKRVTKFVNKKKYIAVLKTSKNWLRDMESMLYWKDKKRKKVKV